jgi:hypothetical protein
VGEYTGAQLEGIEYEQLLPYVQPDKPAFRVIIGDFVTTEDGTGIVHTSPTFGADDFRVAQQNDIPAILVTDEYGKQVPIVDKQGRFVKEITDFAGMYVKNYDGQDESAPDYRTTDVKIAIKLKEENKAFRVEKYEHTYPHCWRTDKPVLYYPLERGSSALRPPRTGWPNSTRPSTGNPKAPVPAVSATGSKTWWTGTCRGPASGARRCPSGAPKTPWKNFASAHWPN